MPVDFRERVIGGHMEMRFSPSTPDPIGDLKRIAADDSQKAQINRALGRIEEQREADKKRIASLETALRTVKRLARNDAEVKSVIDNALSV